MDPVGLVPSHFALIPHRCPGSAPNPGRAVERYPKSLSLQAEYLFLPSSHPKFVVAPASPECVLGGGAIRCTCRASASPPPVFLRSSLQLLEGKEPTWWGVVLTLVAHTDHPGSSCEWQTPGATHRNSNSGVWRWGLSFAPLSSTHPVGDTC